MHTKSMQHLLSGAGVFAAALLTAAPAFATSTGVTGQSGKDGVTCSTCHKGGVMPTVTFEGPTELAPGATGQYSFVIRGGAAQTGGVGIAVDDATAGLQAGAGLKKLGSELTHTAPQPFTGTELRFSFTLVAPAKDSTLTLFGAGNSSNGDQTSEGDRAAATTLKVKVGNGTPPVEEPPPEEEDKDEGGGCTAASGAPLWALGLAGLSLALRRRRNG
ncbi:MXAN_6652 family MXYO-CTERM-anchored protein [Stigmatella hybrida]|uniref:MXAN_6652 family MXYO-CTERM-anchored protein n=1 Tax=Stigmatella hybrida TaxID=394097 RepID=UPI001CDB43C3|nr:MXAN_6652 family MXYO-CTERM-anchored protein [Stigmatella hybrida]